jgi:hypothetical protein
MAMGAIWRREDVSCLHFIAEKNTRLLWETPDPSLSSGIRYVFNEKGLNEERC